MAASLRRSSDGSDVPESFICALTGEVLRDPYIDSEGHTYELEAIEAWLAKSGTSPITRTPLRREDLVPNRALRDAIEQWRQSRAAAAAAPAAETTSAAQAAATGAVRAEVSVTAAAAAAADEDDGTTTAVLVRLATVGPATRAPADVVCVIDVSGSMGDEATLQNKSGDVESHGLSLLDVVKHTVRAIVEALRPGDRLALVSFSADARVELGMTRMDASGKKLAAAALERLVPQGSTNLWQGLFRALELLRDGKGVPAGLAATAVSSVLLFTDGMPTIEPPRGHVPMLRRYREHTCRGALPGAVSTFGFGYSLDSKLLADLAAEGGGAFNFIPDAGLVGTVFVNSAANLLAVGAKDVVLTLRPLNGAAFADAAPVGWPPAAMQGPMVQGELCINLGTIQHGQPRDVVVRMRGLPPLGSAFVQASLSSSRSERPIVVEGSNREPQAGEVEVQLVRCKTAEALRRAVADAAVNLDRARERMAEFAARIRSLPIASDPRVAALLQDLDGQVAMALAKSEWYDRWGKHFLPSIAGAHLLQQCNNFKDPGVQHYGGTLFSELRDEIDEIFVKLPPPTPSAHRPPSPPAVPRGRQAAQAAAAKPSSASSARRRPVVDMSAYMDASGGCFAGQCNVLMADGTERRADSIQRGDVLSGGAKVLCVVRTTCAKGTAMLVALPGGLLITPWHPVDVDGSGVWQFPHDIAPETLRERPCAAHFTFVLDSVHHAIVCGIRCVTLAHGAVGDIREHAYFGTRRVVDDLAAAPGWDGGIVDLAPAQLLRDPGTSLVRGIAVGEL